MNFDTLEMKKYIWLFILIKVQRKKKKSMNPCKQEMNFQYNIQVEMKSVWEFKSDKIKFWLKIQIDKKSLFGGYSKGTKNVHTSSKGNIFWKIKICIRHINLAPIKLKLAAKNPWFLRKS